MYHAFLYDGTMHDLGTLGGLSSGAAAINASGQIVGFADTGQTDASGNNIYHAFLYSNGKMVDLGILDPIYLPYSGANGINASGQIIGDAYNGGFGHIPFLWTPDVPNGTQGKMQMLSTLITPDSAMLLTQMSAASINDLGQIVGTATPYFSGQIAYLLTPTNVLLHQNVFTLTDPVTKGKAAGIVCDNLPCTPDSDKDALTIQLLRPYDKATIVSDTLTNPDGSNTDVDGNNNVGTLSAETASGTLTYTPPNEFNERQQAHSADDSSGDVSKEATRTVLLNVTLKQPDGTVYTVNAQPIILARPPVVLVHGINNSPANWVPFITRANAYHIPCVTVNHNNPTHYSSVGIDFSQVDGGLFKGNGPVEVGAYLLEGRIVKTLQQVRYGQSITDGDENTADAANTFDQYKDITGKPIRLAIKRVDVVGWSYGGVITRWYIASRGNLVSKGWYQRPYSVTLPPPYSSSFNFNTHLPVTTYGDDIRKFITVGSMWRGVPLVNYLNEAVFPPTNEVDFSTAPVSLPKEVLTVIDPLVGETINVPTLQDFVDLLENLLPKKYKVLVHVPSMEVMAINSPWMSQLLYGTQNPSSSTPAQPFNPNIAYGSVAGDNNAYQLGGLFDVHALVDEGQSPTWFPYLHLERRHDNPPRGYSDGLVPVWSTAIPGSYAIAPCPHDGYASDPDTQNYILQWLNNDTLPMGSTLNTIWNDPAQAYVKSMEDENHYRKVWHFNPSEMAPHIENDLYQCIGGVGRINPVALREVNTAAPTGIGPNDVTISWLTATDTDSTVHLNQAGLGGSEDVTISTPTKIHNVGISGLDSDTDYYYPVDSLLNNGLFDDPIDISSEQILGNPTFTTSSSYQPDLALSFVSCDSVHHTFQFQVLNFGGPATKFQVVGLDFPINGYSLAGTLPSTPIDIPTHTPTRLPHLSPPIRFKVVYLKGPDSPTLFCRIRYTCIDSKGKTLPGFGPWMQIK